MKKEKMVELEKLLEGLMELKIDEKNLDVYEQVIYDRGVSSGYFEIDIENTIDFDVKENLLYVKGQLHGIEKLEVLSEEEKATKHYTEAKKSYLRSLGSWYAKGILLIDESLLKEEEKEYFYQGYEITLKEKNNNPVRKIVR